MRPLFCCLLLSPPPIPYPKCAWQRIHCIAHQRFHGYRSCPTNRCNVPIFCTLQLNIMTLQCGCMNCLHPFHTSFAPKIYGTAEGLLLLQHSGKVRFGLRCARKMSTGKSVAAVQVAKALLVVSF